MIFYNKWGRAGVGDSSVAPTHGGELSIHGVGGIERVGFSTLESSPLRPSASSPSTEWRGEMRRIYNNLGQEVTLPHLMGKGRGWGFPR